MSEDPPKNLDTRRLDKATQKAVEDGPPRRYHADDQERCENELWVHVHQIWPAKTNGDFEFQIREHEPILMATRDTTALEGQCQYDFPLQDLTPHDEWQRFHPDGTFFNFSTNQDYKIEQAKKLQRVGQKIRFGHEDASESIFSPANTELIYDTYPAALGLLRNRALTNVSKRHYSLSFLKLDYFALTLFDSLIALTTFQVPSDAAELEKKISDALLDNNLKTLIGENTANVFANTNAEQLRIKSVDYATLHERQIPSDEREKISAMLQRISKQRLPPAPVLDTKVHDEYISRILAKVMAVHTLTHPSQGYLQWLDRDSLSNTFKTATGKNISALNHFTRNLISYFGQENYPGTQKTVLDFYKETWGAFKEHLDETLKHIHDGYSSSSIKKSA